MKVRARRIVRGLATIVCLVGLGLAAYIYEESGLYGFGVLFLRGGSFWTPVALDSPRLSSSMKAALAVPSPSASAGPLVWDARTDGFETAELPVLAGSHEVDCILLARIDPARFRFEVRNAPAGLTTIDGWMATSGVVFVVNGSYYDRHGLPDTPFLSGGHLLGPAHYAATHGAFVVSDASAGINDLTAADWHAAFAGAHDAMVSYPMLIGADGKSRVSTDQGWLANRSFVAQDHTGRIVIGTTKQAFFTLSRLAAFLQQAPLDLSLALNLDGGPVACQGISLPGYTRRVCGEHELAIDKDGPRLLSWGFGSFGRWALPIVLVAVRK